jgi:hypothetical protein
MTKKRFSKLLRAYFTRLNEWAKKADPNNVMKMGQVYKRLSSERMLPAGMTRAEWWTKLKEINCNVFGVGEKQNNKHK